MSMRPIIVAIDFSNCSFNALEHAVTIAKKGGIDLRMVWVKKPESSSPTYLDGGSDQISTVKTEFEKLIGKYQPLLTNSVIDYKIREGKVHKEIVTEAEENNASLVITGAHGTSGFEEMWMGSNANKIVSHAPCPVITILGETNIGRDLNKILMPIDSTSETRQKVPFTTQLAKMFHAEIHILVMYSTKVTAVRSMIDVYAKNAIKYLTENGVKHTLEAIEANNQVEDIINAAKRIDANLISIMSEMEKSTRNIWQGSYAQQLTNQSPFPILVIHPKNVMSGSIGF